MIVGGVAIGVMSIGLIGLLIQYMKPMQKRQSTGSETVTNEDSERTLDVQIPANLIYLCIHAADLEDITQLLTTFKKQFHVIQTLTPCTRITQ